MPSSVSSGPRSITGEVCYIRGKTTDLSSGAVPGYGGWVAEVGERRMSPAFIGPFYIPTTPRLCSGCCPEFIEGQQNLLGFFILRCYNNILFSVCNALPFFSLRQRFCFGICSRAKFFAVHYGLRLDFARDLPR